MVIYHYFCDERPTLRFSLDEAEAAAERIDGSQIESLYLFGTDGEEADLGFLSRIGRKEEIRRLRIDCDVADLAPVYELPRLEELTLVNRKKQNVPLDLARLPLLSKLCLTGPFAVTGVSGSILRSLCVDGCSLPDGLPHTLRRLSVKGDFSFGEVAHLSSLRELSVEHARFSSLDGIEALVSLESLSVIGCRNLSDISAAAQCEALERVEFKKIRHLTGAESLGVLRRLRTLTLRSCGEIPSLAFLNGLPVLERLDFEDTNIADGDLAPCMRLKRVRASGKRHYNRKTIELPGNE